MKILAINKKAKWDFEIYKKYIAGINLLGAEVKATKEGKMNLKDSFCFFKKNELFLINAYIGRYSKSSENIPPYRERKLLLQRKELEEIKRELNQRNLIIVPLKAFDKNGWIKLEIGLGRKKKKKEKKEILKQKAIEREIEQDLKNYRTI